MGGVFEGPSSEGFVVEGLKSLAPNNARPPDGWDTPYVYVFVRSDLPAAVQMVQVGHACLEAGRRFLESAEGLTPCHLVLLSVPSEARLQEIASRLRDEEGIRSVVFFEPDGGWGHTAACTEPVFGKQRRAFRRFRLWHQLRPP